MHAGYDLWLPQNSGAHDAQTYATFHGRMAVANLLGNTKGETQIGLLNLTAMSNFGGQASNDLSKVISYETQWGASFSESL